MTDLEVCHPASSPESRLHWSPVDLSPATTSCLLPTREQAPSITHPKEGRYERHSAPHTSQNQLIGDAETWH